VKILFITFFFPPYKTVASIRTGKTAKLLYEMGHDVKVVSSKNNDMKEELKVEIPIIDLYQTNWLDLDDMVLKLVGKSKETTRDNLHQGGKITFKNKLIKLFFSIYKYFFYTPDKYIGWYKYAFNQAEEIIKDWKPDVIYASATPYTGLIIASDLSKKYNIPFIAELRDLWSDNHSNRQYLFGKYLEFITLKKASAIVSVSAPLVNKLQSKYKNIPCYEIRNAFDEEDFKYQLNNTGSEKISIIYTGMIYPNKQNPNILFEAISKDYFLKENVKCMFYGNSLGWVKNIADEYGISSNVEVYNSIDRDEVLKLQSKSDILLLLTWNDPKEKGVFTGKLFEYIGSAKPILSIGAIDDVASMTIVQNGFGLASNNIDEIIYFIKSIKNKELLESVHQSYSNNRMKFERKEQVKKLSDIFSKLVLKNE